ncbi:DUF2914 domain-containing protein [bacterium]|nr:DUF2914 domain-containing protein [bacterium]
MTRAILIVCLAAAIILAAGCSGERGEDASRDASTAEVSGSSDSSGTDMSTAVDAAIDVSEDAVAEASGQTIDESHDPEGTTDASDDPESMVDAPGGEPLPLEMTPTEQETPRQPDIPREEPVQVSPSGLTVIRAYICKGIEQSEPTEAGRSFLPEGDGVGRLCCFSEIGGAAEPDSVFHVWYWGDRNMGQVPLEVKSSRWRTWSKKKVLDEWRGEWHVDIVDRDGFLLERLSFSIE